KDAEKSFILSIKVNKQSSGDIDPSKVMVRVFFYDTVDHQEIKLTEAAATQSEWLKGKRPKPDWRAKNPEMLTVYHTRFKSAKPSSRDYLGYRVLVYYDNKLQDQRAHPLNLSTIFPASPFAVPPSYSDTLKALARKDYPGAAELLQRAADQGFAVAQVNLGWSYHEGQGVPRDVELYQKAADQRYAVGQAYLASAYADG